MNALVHSAVRRTPSLAILLGCLLALASAGDPWSAAENVQARSLQDSCLGAGKAQVAVHAATGKVRFVGTDAAQHIARPLPLTASASAESVARAYLSACGELFGLRSQASELGLMHSKALDDGRAQVRFQQLYQGIPVMGGELITVLDASRNIVSVSGEILPGIALSPAPAIGAAAARETARDVVAKNYQLDPALLSASEPQLWIFDPAIVGGRSLPRTSLVWRMQVEPADRLSIRELVLVDAQLGAVTLHFNEIDTAKNRRIYDKNNVVSATLPGTLVRSEGQGPSGIPDADNAYLFAGDAYDYFFNNFGRDSIDGAGMTLTQTVCYCEPGYACPYQNAFWNGQQMVYGQGYASADDVVGHEMTHGVTERESHLFYYYQSGAINEAFSDIFGELMDLGNGHGNDLIGVRWLLGEDLPIGAIRSMSNPPAYNDPDRIGSAFYTCDVNELDSGGVHTNSGVFNKAVFLMVDGGVFNGQTVGAIGATKAAKIVYEAETNLLTSASDYQDLFNALQQACSNLVGFGGITAADCAQVQKAVTATEMNQQPGSCGAPHAAVCPANLYPLARFRDDFENPASGKWSSAALAGVNRWFYPQNSNPYGFDATYATSGIYNVWGYATNLFGDFVFRMNANVALPAGQSYLHFNHAFGFEDGAAAYDGGVLEYTINNGVAWNDAGALGMINGYNGTVYASGGNPLANRPAFVRESNGYISTRVDLAALAGQNVRFRFRLGTDSSVDDLGWWIDDVMIYTCTDKVNFLPLIRR